MKKYRPRDVTLEIQIAELCKSYVFSYWEILSPSVILFQNTLQLFERFYIDKFSIA